MSPEHDIGSQLGHDGVTNVIAKAEQYCVHEEQHIALENHAPIAQLKAELSLLMNEESHVQEQIRQAPAPMNLRHHLRRKIMAWTVTLVLTITGFFFAVLTFAPFRLGWQAYVFCAGITTVMPFLIDRLLQDHRLEPLIKSLTAIAAAAGIASLMLLAGIRGTLLAHEVQSPSTVVIDDTQTAEESPANDFYSKTLGGLRLATIFLSFAMELGAGIALRDAMAASPHDPGEWTRLRAELVAIRRRMIALAGEITRLEDGPAKFHTRFWRDFYRSMLTHTVRSAMTKLLVLIVVLASASQMQASTPEHMNLVIAIDLTTSVNVKGPDAKTDFQKNVDGVTRILAQVPAGAHVTIIGITDRSFTQPYILLSATIPHDPGYFGERLNAARTTLTRTWKQRSAKLEPHYPATDIVGALELASQIFDQHSTEGQRILVLFSDMRNHTKELDLESPAGIASAANRPMAAPNLKTLSVYALGVDGAGGTLLGWRQIKGFWQEYFRRCGASITEYSALRTAVLR